MVRDDTLRPDRDTLRSWATWAGVGALAALVWCLTWGADPMLAGIGKTGAVFGVPVLLGVLFLAVYRTGIWLTSRVAAPAGVTGSVTAPAPDHAPGAAPEPVNAPAPTTRTVTRYEDREVRRKVARKTGVDPDEVVAQAVTAVRRHGYKAADRIPGVTLDFDTLVKGVGAIGEEMVGRTLENDLPDEWAVSHDIEVLNRSASKVSANIDHLVTTPAGVVMVDAKSWSGTLGLRKKRLTRLDGKDPHRARADAPGKLAFEAGAANAGAGMSLVSRIVIAVVDGTVGTDGSGILEVPPPPREADAAEVPIVAVEHRLLAKYLTGLGGDSQLVDLEALVAGSPRLRW
jgi:hypothetical protein